MKLQQILSLFVVGVVIAGCSKPAEQAAPKEDNAPKVAVQTTPAQQASGNLEVSPSTLRSGQRATLRFVLKDAQGELIRDASVRATLTMPMGKSQVKDSVNLKWDGSVYAGSIKPSMAGAWDVAVEAQRDGKLLLSVPAQIDVK